MFFWDEDGVRWYQAAAAYSDFHARLAQMIAMGLTPDDTLCDLGCGVGCLSLALAPYVREVTAVDIDARALAALRAQAAVHNAPPIRIIQAAFPDLPPDSLWDAVVCCFFGRLTDEGMLDRLLSLCRRQLIVVVNTGQKSNIAPSGRSHHQKECSNEVAALLKERGLAFRFMTAALEFGQPADSLEDASAFILHYSPGCSAPQALNHARRQAMLLPDGRYYLPNEKQFTVFFIEARGA